MEKVHVGTAALGCPRAQPGNCVEIHPPEADPFILRIFLETSF
jgi:hypothetical protein